MVIQYYLNTPKSVKPQLSPILSYSSFSYPLFWFLSSLCLPPSLIRFSAPRKSLSNFTLFMFHLLSICLDLVGDILILLGVRSSAVQRMLVQWVKFYGMFGDRLLLYPQLSIDTGVRLNFFYFFKYLLNL